MSATVKDVMTTRVAAVVSVRDRLTYPDGM
jgi:hypothetical protein